MRHFPVCRRRLLLAGAAAAAGLAAPRFVAASTAEREPLRLVAAPGRVPLVGPPHPETDVWCYGGSVPGPEIRVRRGEPVRVLVDNRLGEETTVHWHGIRLPNAMDGVPRLTQPPIAPGERFLYEFDAVDAGTFWYHPHQHSAEQVGRGLYGALVVEEAEPYPVDRDIVWVLDDWRLTPQAAIAGGFGDLMDMSHAGRIGNSVTINGQIPGRFPVRAGERIRLRLINAANGRIFGLEFAEHAPWVIALDGQPVAPHRPDGGRVVLGPAMRADLVLDMSREPGGVHRIVDAFYAGREYRLVDLAYSDAPPAGEPRSEPPPSLPYNPLPEPDPAAAVRHEIRFEGGMMGGMSSGMMAGRMRGMREMMQAARMWAVNGVIADGHELAPMLTLKRGATCVLAMRNDTAWHHPVHLHGHSFRVLSRNGATTARREWRDTVLMGPRETAEIAFVADNPGDWMLHCHILEHQQGGMMAVVRVA